MLCVEIKLKWGWGGGRRDGSAESNGLLLLTGGRWNVPTPRWKEGQAAAQAGIRPRAVEVTVRSTGSGGVHAEQGAQRPGRAVGPDFGGTTENMDFVVKEVGITAEF